MRIAVPTEGEGGLDAARSGHFGRSASFTLVDVEDDAIAGCSALENGPHVHGACGSIVGRLVEAGANAVIAVGMGGGPRTGFAEAGVPVYVDDVSPTPRAAVQAYLAGSRATFTEDHVCRGH